MDLLELQLELQLVIQKIVIIYIVISYIFTIIGMYKILEKAGKEGYKGLIPIYNRIELLKLVGKPWWWIFLICISFVGYINYIVIIPNIQYFAFFGLIWSIWAANMLSKSFGRSTGFTVGLIFFPYIFYPILGFGKDKYLGPYGDRAAFEAFNNKEKQFDFENDILHH